VPPTHEHDFLTGLQILAPYFEAQDFELRVYPPLAGQDGTIYFAQFVWGNHAVTLQHHRALGPVTYSVGAMSLTHEEYLAALGVAMGAAFPPDHAGGVAGYSALLSDLESRLSPFFEAPDREFTELASLHGRGGTAWLPTANLQRP
jgi:hypothetical protein